MTAQLYPQRTQTTFDDQGNPLYEIQARKKDENAEN
jgi:hypothetical protein